MGGAAYAESYYVLSDNYGFVGAFCSVAEAEEVVILHYPTPFLLQRFGVEPGQIDTIWVIPYKGIDAVAYVSNSREAASAAHEALCRVGLAYDDPIDYWEQPANRIAQAAAPRLAALSKANAVCEPPTLEDLRAREMADYARIAQLTKPRPDGPLQRLIRENERITVLDCVVPVAVGGGARADGEAGGAAAGGTAASDSTAASGGTAASDSTAGGGTASDRALDAAVAAFAEANAT
jgi:hypothetical protein